MDTNNSIRSRWSELCMNHSLPASLHPHQADAMSLLEKGKHVLLGKNLQR